MLVLLLLIINIACFSRKGYSNIESLQSDSNFVVSMINANKFYRDDNSKQIFAWKENVYNEYLRKRNEKSQFYKIDFSGAIKDSLFNNPVDFSVISNDSDIVSGGKYFSWLIDGNRIPQPFLKLYNKNNELKQAIADSLFNAFNSEASVILCEVFIGKDFKHQQLFSFKINKQWIGLFLGQNEKVKEQKSIRNINNFFFTQSLKPIHFDKKEHHKSSLSFINWGSNYNYWSGIGYYSVKIAGKIFKFKTTEGTSEVYTYALLNKDGVPLPFVIIKLYTKSVYYVYLVKYT